MQVGEPVEPVANGQSAARTRPGSGVPDIDKGQLSQGSGSVGRPPFLDSQRALIRWAWRQLTSMRTALVLLFLLAVAAVPGSLIPQVPVSPAEVVAFKSRHPSLSPAFEAIGLFDVYSSPWFSAVYSLLMVSLVGCVLPRLRVYLRLLRSRPPAAPRRLDRFASYTELSSSAGIDLVAEAAVAELRRSRHRVVTAAADGGVVVSAEKGYLREAGNLLFHLSLIIVLVGVAVSNMFGFKGAAIIVVGDGFSNSLIDYDEFRAGRFFDPNDLPQFGFTVDTFDVQWQETGAGTGTPIKFDAGLTVTTAVDAPPEQFDLQVNDPLSVDGVSVFLVGHGYAPLITLRDGEGAVVFSGPVVFLPQDGSFLSFGVVKAPDARPSQIGLEGYFFPTLGLCGTAPCSLFPDAKRPGLSLLAYKGDLGLDTGTPQSVYVMNKAGMEPVDGQGSPQRPLILSVGQTRKLGDGLGSVTFDGFDRFIRVQISRQPLTWLPLTGVLLAIVGMLGSLFVRPRRTWLRLTPKPEGVLVEVAALDKVSGGDPERHVTALVDRLAQKVPLAVKDERA